MQNNAFPDDVEGGEFETFKQYDPHNHPLTHSHSYRDILHDVYIK